MQGRGAYPPVTLHSSFFTYNVCIYHKFFVNLYRKSKSGIPYFGKSKGIPTIDKNYATNHLKPCVKSPQSMRQIAPNHGAIFSSYLNCHIARAAPYGDTSFCFGRVRDPPLHYSLFTLKGPFIDKNQEKGRFGKKVRTNSCRFGNQAYLCTRIKTKTRL